MAKSDSLDRRECDRDLVTRAQNGDEAAFAGLYDAYASRIYRYVLARTGHEADAEDITSEVFMKVLDALPSFRWKEAPFSAWLFRIARNHVISHHRRDGTRPQTSDLPYSLTSGDPGPEELAEVHMTLADVWQAMAGLSDNQRHVLELRFAAGLSVAETARVLGKGAGNVKATQHHAVVRLKQLLTDKRGYEGLKT